jgi:hypothetical protein
MMNINIELNRQWGCEGVRVRVRVASKCPHEQVSARNYPGSNCSASNYPKPGGKALLSINELIILTMSIIYISEEHILFQHHRIYHLEQLNWISEEERRSFFLVESFVGFPSTFWRIFSWSSQGRSSKPFIICASDGLTFLKNQVIWYQFGI